MTSQNPGFDTLAIHAGTAPDPTTGARSVPIYQTTSYVFQDADHAASLFNLEQIGFIYSRLTNPTVSALEARLAALEGAVGATCCASGHAAQQLVLFALMSAGDELVASRRLYGGSINQFNNAFRKFGWTVKWVDGDDIDEYRRAITDKTRAIFIESLANPGGVVSDISAIAEVARDARVPLIVDNTMASPWLCRPIDHGADIVVHSTTKFLSGHGHALGGAVLDSGRFDWTAAGKYPSLAEPDPGYHGLNFHQTFGEMALTFHGHAIGLRDLGATMAPMNAFLTLTGVETLSLRMDRHVKNAQAVATFLENHPQVAWVSYAGLASSPYHALAQKYLPRGAGSVFTFGVKGGYDMGRATVENTKLFSHLANLGDTRSLIIHPASTTHRQLDEAHQIKAGAGPDVVRISIGLEDVDDITADLDQALTEAAKAN